ncbi:hypothetical protein AYL99_11684 [Fonsecaea erecta]|uniref:Uncharacterized protein n=1 Tax=Fonsecaea erecta TaxID=1367422 RepID=A0A178Z2X1_9EURO|nr:hypothetical protein AYL99_11684 [Fonsecaea erecta]OAP54149.1 hypothetical protein AYL99_11684 [Fonsecaea erecta]
MNDPRRLYPITPVPTVTTPTIHGVDEKEGFWASVASDSGLDDISILYRRMRGIMWVIMITSCLPDMGLELKIAVPDILERPPISLKAGVFT